MILYNKLKEDLEEVINLIDLSVYLIYMTFPPNSGWFTTTIGEYMTLDA